ncbi:MAG: hypothetical protein WA705_06590 [Candidatus Ozemobacteraceae bacterium]
MNFCKGILLTSFAVFAACSPLMAQDAVSADAPQDTMVVVPTDSASDEPGGVASSSAPAEPASGGTSGVASSSAPTEPASGEASGVASSSAPSDPEQDVETYAPVKIFVHIDGKPVDSGVVVINDREDTILTLGISNGTAKTILRKDQGYLITFSGSGLKFKSNGPVFLGKGVDSARIEIAYNSKQQKWAFNWKKFGDHERCSIYVNIKRSNRTVPKDYRITLLEGKHVILKDVWFGKDGKFTFLLTKPEKGEQNDRYFALLTSNQGPDFRYKFSVGPQSNRIRHELVIPAKGSKEPNPGTPRAPGTKAGSDSTKSSDPAVQRGVPDDSGIE